ncbi:non-ribosomal peptide synthase protein (TIGR01720 family)/amino acid adenylation domain-containing protein [Pseudonocardia hierapolitana]|uniref:Non-ribosomal peptide synthase protein (TIGR01720 family)/amino acid adenylation domain-containing protein n=1 Tax=Pseudonocardia hierapolitana TaxID=1128676 RepID=A0A561T094_9PSEU|nr:non-ribosomal peptide synthetase [Pseudonocardia hierapolitana]TWF80521.1 non-ribosomal peptide synthase protein (TIGR01720 family)/amino acid adenylation domain-containing protein [Pseudonocardia hierapolitana]
MTIERDAFDTLAERLRALAEWNDSTLPSHTTTVAEMFERAVRAHPDALALVAGSGGGGRSVQLTYTELAERVNQLAHHLLERGLTAEQVVAVHLPRSAEMVVSVLAIMVAGGAFVPVDPEWPQQRRRQVLDDAGAVMMVTAPAGTGAPEGGSLVPAAVVDLDAWAYAGLPARPPAVTVEPQRLAYVMFTSGSTGKPKGAMIRHEAICNRLQWQVEKILGFGPGDAALFKAPLSFDISVNEILLPLVSGGYVVVAEPGGDRDPQYLLDVIATEGVTFVYLVSSMLDVLLEMARGTAKLDGLKHVWCGGEVLTPELFERFRAQLTTTLYHGYGPAEATIGVSHVIYRDDAERIATSIGRPNPYTQLYVLDENLHPAPVGVGGELYAGGFLLGRGYVNAPGLTAARFVANPFADDGSRLYRTGDLARWHEDGSLEFLGRADNQVKIRGMRLELEEVEAVLATHPGVRQAVVMARDNAAGAKYLAGYALATTVGEEDLRRWCADRLPEYMVPTTFTVLDAFPLTSNGKVDRKALPEPRREGRAGRAPRTPRERTLCGIFADVLGLPEVGADDDFFALGGDSIVAIGVVSRARRAGLVLRPRELFELRTPAALALAASDADPAERVATVEPVGGLPATPVLEWLWETGPSEGFYQSITVHSPAELTPDRLTEVASALLRHHDVLRAVVATGADGRPTVRVPAEVPAPSVTHVRLGADESVDERLSRETAAAVSRLDAGSGRMVEFVWLDRGSERHGRLVVAVHHVVVDGVSLRILAEDLQALWAGRTPDPASTSFREWALALADAARAGEFDDDLAFWREVAAAPNPVIGRRALDAGVDTVATERELTVTLPSALTEPLLGAVPAAIHGGVNDALVAALALAVIEWRGEAAGRRLLLEMEGHGREAELLTGNLDLSRTVGWFTTLYPVAIEVPDGGSAAVVKGIKEQLRAVPRNGLSYGALQYLTDARADLAVAPALLFNYLGRFSADSEVGEDRDPRMPLPRALEINAITVDTTDGPVLSARFSWPAAVLDEAEVGALAELWLERLGAIAGDETVAGFTPSDFPLVELDPSDVDELEREVPDLQDVLPLLPLQEGMYFHASYGDDADDTVDAYRIQQIAELTGPLDADKLKDAVAAMIDRHPALRAGFRGLADGRVVQVVSGHVDLDWRAIDLTDRSHADAVAELERAAAADRARPFVLAEPPLLRYSVVSLTPTEHRLVQTMHHIIADGWSYPLMFNDIVDAYRGTLRGLPAVALGQHIAAIARSDAQETGAVWADALACVDEPTLLVDADPGAAVGEHRIVAEELSAEATAALARTARDLGVTLSTVLHAAWGLLLGGTVGEDTVVFGSTVSGRAGNSVPGVDAVVGLLINTVPVPMTWAKDEPVGAVVRRLQDEQTAVLDHQHAGLAELTRSRGLRTLFDTLVIVENFPEVYAPADDGLSVRGFTSTTFSHYPVSMVAFPGERLRVEVKYDVGLVSEDRAHRLLRQVTHVLDRLAADPGVPVGRLELIGPDERTLVLDTFNDTAHDLGAPTLRSRFEHWAARTPDTTAVVFEGEAVTYAELNARANRLAHRLIAQGVRRGSVVAVVLERSVELIVALYAVHKAGAAYLPVDPGYPAERIAFMLDDARPAHVLDDPAAFPTDGDESNPDVEVTPADPAYVIYTSGSTGRPKGVVVPHGAAANFLSWMQETYRLEPGEPTLLKTPSSFDASLRELFWPLMSGATMVIAKPEGHKDAAYLAELIQAHQVTTAQFVPSMFGVFLEEPTVRRCTSLRRVICGGEALPADVVARFRAITELTGAELHNVYGPTEAAIDVTGWDTSERPDRRSVPVGRPVFNTRLYVLDGALRPVPPGTDGELYIAGVQLAYGYLNRPGLTAERFVADPNAAGERMYRSGDLARWDDTGVLEILGRSDHQVQVRGFRIEPGEIEAALVAADEVTRAVVVVRDGRLVAYVVGAGIDPEALREQVSRVLPEHMVPSIVVVLDAFPLTPNGKLDRKALPDPDFGGLVSDRGPRTEREERLCGLFADALRLERVGIDDDFFALGGDSITSIAVSGRARRAGMRITPRDIFRLRTVQALAAGLGDALDAALDAAPAPEADDGAGPVPLTPVMAEVVQDGIPLENFFQSMLVRTPASLTRGDLERILRAVVDRHALLRAAVDTGDDTSGAWALHVPEAAGGPVPITESTGDAEPSPEVVERATREEAALLDARRGVMLRAHWFRDAGRLLLVAHHLVIDGVSWRILTADLAAAWQALAAGREPEPEPVGTSYRSWSRILRQAAESGDFRAELGHWRDVLSTPDPVLGDRALDPRTDVDATTDTLDVDLPPEVFGSLAPAIHGGVDDILLTGLAVALQQWRRRRGVDAGSAVLLRVKGHGREGDLFDTSGRHIDLSRTVGSFTSIYPVRLDPGEVSSADVTSAGPRLARAAKLVKDQLRVPSAGIGYGVLRYLDEDADLPAVTPQIVFNYRGRSAGGSDDEWGFTSVGSGLDPRSPVDALEINVMGEGTGGSATMTWPTGILAAGAVGELASLWVDALRALVGCAELRGHTPSDFPLVDLSLDDVQAIEAAAAVPVADIWPLSPLQEGLFFQSRIAGEGDVYLAQDAFDFDSRLDVDALTRACALLLEQNSALRLGFTDSGLDRPVAVVAARLEPSVSEIDLSGLSAGERAERTEVIMAADRRTPFDLTRPPLVRLTVLRGDGRDRLLLTRHLLLWDGWSRELVLRRLFGAYTAVRRGEAPPEPVPAQFPDYLAWLAEQDDEASAAAWSQAFADLAEPTILFPEAVGTDPVIATRMSVELTPEMTARLSEQARAIGVTLNSVVGTALGLVLGHAAGTDDVVFGMTVAGRPTEVEGIESVVGVFLNTIPARVRLDPRATMADAVRGMHEQRIAMMPYEYLGLGDVQRAVGKGQLFDNLYVLQNFVDDETFTDLEAEHGILSAAGVDSTHYPLTWVVYPGERLWIKLEHRSDVVPRDIAAALLARLEQVLLGLADNLAQPVGEIGLLTPSDAAAQHAEWEKAVQPIGSATIADLLAERAAALPGETALVFGDTRLTYDELDARVNRLAHHLLAAGAAPERIVGLALPRSIDMVVALFAVLRTGAAYLPLDLEYPDERLAAMTADARPMLLLSTSAVSSRFAGTAAPVTDLDTLDLSAYPAAAPGAAELGAFAPDRPGRLDHPAYVIYTSGSTGRPKGVVTPYRGLTNMQLNHRVEIFDPTVSAAGGRRLRIAHTVSFSFDMSWEELLWLVEGHEVHICDEELRRDARALVDHCRRHGIDVVNVTPTYAQVLIEEGLVTRHPLALMLLGGEAVPDSLWTALRESDSLGYNLYGPTEYTINTLGAGTAESTTSTVGHPIFNTRAYVLDGWLRPVDAGVVGELYIAGAGLARGYLNRPGLTAERFVADPWNPGGRMYRTGDLVRRRPDGNLDFLGRTDDQVKIRGYRVELGEIESVLAGQPGVRRVAVIARADGAVKRLAAFVVPDAGADRDELPSALQAALANVLPDYMVPTLYGVVDDLPLTVNGKLDTGALPEPRPVARRGGRAPSTEAERVLVGIVASVVGLGADEVGVDDDFFTLGGDSISSITLCGRARKAGLDIAPRDVFRKRTVQAMAAGTAVRAERPREVRDVGVGAVPTTPILAAFERMPLENFYQSMVVRTPAGMTRAELETVLAAILERHDLLRARVDAVGSAGAWQLWVRDPGSTDVSRLLEVTERSGRPTRAEMAVATRAAAAALDARGGTMVRAHWFRDEAGAGCLLLVVHHLVIDGVSWRILTADLAQAWSAVRAGRPPQLDEVATSFRTWARRMRSAADRGLFRGEAEYWRDIVSTPDPDLGSRALDPAVDVAATTDTVTLRLPAEVTGPLLSTVPAAIHGGINDVLLSAFGLAVAHWRRLRGRAESSAVLLSLEGHGREPEPFETDGQLDLSRTVGWFTSLYPVRLDPGVLEWDDVVAAGPRLARAVKTVKEQLRVPARGIGYGVLNDLDAEVDLPDVEPQILFNYLGRFGAGAEADWEPVGDYDALGEGVDPSSEVRALSVNAITHDSAAHDTAAGPEFSAVLTWPTGIMSRAEIEHLAWLWEEALRAVAASAELAGHTPSDFPLVTMTMDDVAELEAAIPGGPADVLPLLPLQQGMYFHSVQAVSGEVADRDPYVIQHVLELRGAVDPELLRRAVEAMVARHPVLRAGFRELGDGRVVQVVAGQVSPDWEAVDLRDRPGTFADIANERFRTVFDLAAPPLLRYTLVTLADDRHRLVQTMHHLLADGWSYPLMFDDVMAAYRQLVRTGRTDLPAPAVTFADHVAQLAGRDPAASREAWTGVLAGVDGPTKLIDVPQGAEVTSHADVQHELPAEVTARLTDRARAAGVTLSTVVHGAWGLLLGRTLGRERVVFGSTVSGRAGNAAGIEQIVGPLINTVPVPMAWAPGEPLDSVFARLQDQQLAVLDHQHLGLVELARIAGVSELFDTIVVVENFAVTEPSEPTADGLPTAEWIDGTDAAHYPVALVVHPDERLRLKITYDTGLVEAGFARRLVEQMALFLEQFADDPATTVAGLRVGAAPPVGRASVPDADDRTLADRFRQVARAHPDAVAVRDRRSELTYAELDARSDALAHRLAEQGVRLGSRVAIVLPRSVDLIVAVVGVLKAGGCYVPIDPGSPAARIAYILDDSAPDCVLAVDETATVLPEGGPPVLMVDGPGAAGGPVPLAGHPDADAYVIYTSGSTGLPKGVAVPHRSVTALFAGAAADFDFGPDDVWTLFHSFAFDFSVWEIWGALLHGGRLVVVDHDVARDPERFRALLSDEAVTVLNQTPSAFYSLIAADRDSTRPLALRYVVFGGEALDLRRLAPWFERHGDAVDDTGPRLVNMYGITETCVHVTVRALSCDDVTRTDSVIGTPLAGLTVHVLDRYLQPVPPGVTGEVYVAGGQLARGYLDRASLTAARFVADPNAAGERLYRSGDLARWTETGELVYLGRSDHQLKLRGFRIEPGEVEAALLELDGVDGAAVSVQRDAQGRPRLVAHLVARDAADLDANLDAVRRHAATVLPEHMVPAVFAVVESLPLTINGKLDRDALPAIAEPRRDPVGENVGTAQVGVSAEALAALFGEILGVDAPGADADFFALGGDSIIALQLVNRMKRIGLRVSPREVFLHRTPAALAALAAPEEPAVPEDDPDAIGSVMLTPIVHRLAELGGTVDRFNQSELLLTPPGATADRIGAVVSALLRRHDALRLRLSRPAPMLWALETVRELPALDDVFTVVDARGPDGSGLDEDGLAELLGVESDAAANRLRPDEGRMVAAVFFDRGAEPGRLLLVVHHLAVDGVSWRILLDDVRAAWEGGALEPVATSLRTYARVLNEASAQDARLAEFTHWSEVLAPGADLDPTQVVVGRTVGDTREHRFRLTADETLPLLTTVPAAARSDVTETLVTALRAAVSRWREARGVADGDLTIDLERHGREDLSRGDVDLSRTVGWFTSIAPVRLPVGTGELSDRIGEVRDRLRAAPDGGCGFGLLRYCNARTAAPLARLGQPQVLFNYLGRFGAPGSEAWDAAPETAALRVGPAPDMGTPYLLEVNAYCEDTASGPELEVVLTYADGWLDDGPLGDLRDAFGAVLRELAAAAGGTGSLRPSDVHHPDLSASELDAVTAATTVEVEDVWPLSPLQEGIWFQSELAADADVYLAQNAFDFDRRLDADRLAAAYEQVLAANAAMRLGFSTVGDGRTVAFVGTGLRCRMTEVDLTHLDEEEAERRIAELTDADRSAPFDLREPPLARMTVIHRADRRDHLLFTYHLLLWDGWSRELVLNRLFEAYRGEPVRSPRGSFVDYLDWLGRQDVAETTAFWRETFADLPAPTLLYPQAVGTEPVLAQRISAEIPEEVTARLTAQVRAAGVTMNALISTALAVVLGHAAGSSDVVIGTTVAGRPTELDDIDDVVGVFLNTVPARIRLAPGATPAQAMRQVQRHRLDAMPHEYLGLGDVQRAAGRGPLFDSLYVLQNFLDDDTFSDLETRNGIVGVRSVDATHYPLTWVVMPGKRLWVKLEYRPDVVGSDEAAALLERLERLLHRLADDIGMDTGTETGTPIAALPVLTPAEVGAQEAADAAREHPIGDLTIAELLARQALATPDAPALTSGPRTLTYRELDGAISRMARMLIARGAGPETIVGLALPRSIEMVVALFAVLRAGAAYLPLELDHPDERLRTVVDDAAPALLLTTAAVAPRLAACGVELIRTDSDGADFSDAPVEEVAGFAPGTPGRLDHPAYVIYTSGSTGRPKGVVTPYRGLTNMLLNHREAIFGPTVAAAGRGLRIAHTVSFSFDMSWEELLWLVEGHHVHVCDEDLRRDARALVEYCDRHLIDVVNVTPTYAQHLVEVGLLDGHRPALVLLGGEAVPESLWATLREADGVLGYNLYGPTEYTINTLGGGTADSPTATVGTAIWNTRALVLDEWLRPVPAGVAGELYIAGVGIARGYLKRPALTAERFVADPHGSGTRMYRTGDLVRVRPDGNIDFLGRTDDQVKIRGYRVELGEIEANSSAAPGVRRSAVIAADDGAGGKRLVAYLIPAESPVDPDRLIDQVRRHLRDRMPGHLVPTAYAVVDELPLTVNGKLDTAALPPPRTVSVSSRDAATDTERALCAIFAAALGAGAFGVEDDFFDHGGHSLLATRVIGRIREDLGVDVSLRQLFDHPTPERLAAVVDEGREPARTRVAPMPRPERLPLSPAQERLWLLHELAPESVAYNYPLLLRVRGAVDAGAFTAALADVVARHEVLRTLVVEGPEQRVLDHAVPEVEVRDALTTDTGSIVAAAIARPFALSSQIPVRATLIRETDTGDTVVVLVLHHIAVDEWSDRPLLADLDAAYHARRAGAAPELAPLPVQYADYTLWHRDVLGSPDDPHSRCSRQRDFWVRQLAGVPQELALPSVATGETGGGCVSARLDAALADRLREQARASSSSMFLALHAALAMLLSRMGAGTDIPIGSPTSGRGDAALDDLVGFFVNTVVVRTDLEGAPSFAQLLDRVRATGLAALEHADLPFQQVVEAVNPVRVPGRNPLFQVMLGYHRRPDGSAGISGGEMFGLPTAEAPGFTADPKVDLTFTVVDAGPGRPVELSVEYDAARCTAEIARSLAARFEVLLRSALADPDAPYPTLDLLTDDDAGAIARWSRGAEASPGPAWFRQFADAAERTPDAPAVRSGATTLSYADLDAASDAVAAGLAARGAGPETIVGVALPRSLDMIVALVGIAKAGAAFLPLDPEFPAARLRYVVSDAAPTVVLVDGETRGSFEGCAAELVTVGDLADPADPVSLSEPDPAAAAYVIYTSGSTGRPKGVVVGHGNLAHFLAAARHTLPLTPSDRLLAVTTLSFDIATLELMLPLSSGACVVLASTEQVRDPRLLADMIEAESITAMQATPSLWTALLDAADPDLARVTALVGGEALPARLATALGRRAAGLTNMYGPTEVTVWATSADVEREPGIGRPMAGTTAHVLDERLRPVPPGVVGELYLGGPQVARAYLNRRGLSAARFVADPFGSGARMYRTGDLVRWAPSGSDAGGTLEYLGRSDHQVKVRGFRIELGEIESVLESVPGVRRAAVAVHEDRVVAYVVAASGDVASDARESAAERLPAYMVPSIVTVLDALPQTPNGKIDRAALPAPEVAVSGSGTAPESGLERRLCAIFAEILGVQGIGRDDDFFVLGGHSLLLVGLATALRRELGVDIAVHELMAAPTVSALARRIAGTGEHRGGLDPVLVLNQGDGRPPLFAVHPASGLSWQFAGLKPYLPADVPLYGLQAPRLQDPETAPVTLAETVQRYADEVGRLAPEGPIQLMGWSFGGAVAHQVAAELAARGRRIALLAMLDTHLPAGRRELDEWDGSAAIEGLLTELGYPIPVDLSGAMTVADAVAVVRANGGSIAVLDDDRIARVVQTYLASDHMIEHAELAVVTSDVVFVDATVPEQGFTGTASQQWRPHVAGELEVVRVGCAHSELLDPEVVGEWFPAVARVLAQ